MKHVHKPWNKKLTLSRFLFNIPMFYALCCMLDDLYKFNDSHLSAIAFALSNLDYASKSAIS
jgi:hypothetical protein